MKKTYIIPLTETLKLSVESLIAESPVVSDDVQSGTNAGWVKDNSRGSRSDYNVWEDDWSK